MLPMPTSRPCGDSAEILFAAVPTFRTSNFSYPCGRGEGSWRSFLGQLVAPAWKWPWSPLLTADAPGAVTGFYLTLRLDCFTLPFPQRETEGKWWTGCHTGLRGTIFTHFQRAYKQLKILMEEQSTKSNHFFITVNMSHNIFWVIKYQVNLIFSSGSGQSQASRPVRLWSWADLWYWLQTRVSVSPGYRQHSLLLPWSIT